MHGVGAALPIEFGGTALFLSVRLCWCGGDRRVHARYFARSGYQCPSLPACFTPPIMAGHIVQNLAEGEARAIAFWPDVTAYGFSLVQLATVRSIAFDRSSCGRVLSVAQLRWWPQELAVPSLGNDSTRVNLPYQRVTMAQVSSTIAQARAAIT